MNSPTSNLTTQPGWNDKPYTVKEVKASPYIDNTSTMNSIKFNRTSGAKRIVYHSDHVLEHWKNENFLSDVSSSD
jgi:hypothetical protein